MRRQGAAAAALFAAVAAAAITTAPVARVAAKPQLANPPPRLPIVQEAAARAQLLQPCDGQNAAESAVGRRGEFLGLRTNLSSTSSQAGPTAAALPINLTVTPHDMLLFVHIPKTGGTSLNSVIRVLVRQQSLRLCLLLTKRTHSYANSPASFGRCQIISGEFEGSLRFVPTPNRVMGVTVLRNPFRRVLSQFNHHVSRSRLTNEPATLRQFLHPTECENQDTLCPVLKDPFKCLLRGPCTIFQNHQTETIAGYLLYSDALRADIRRSPEALLCAAKNQLGAMTVGKHSVLITEYFDVGVCVLLHTMGLEAPFNACCKGGRQLTCDFLTKASHHNVRDRKHSKDGASAPASYRDQFEADGTLMADVKQANALDCRLYNHGLGLFEQQVRAVEAKTGRAFLSPEPIPRLEC